MKKIILIILSSISINSYTAEQGIISFQPTATNSVRNPRTKTELRSMLIKDCMTVSCTVVSIGFSVPFFKFLAEGDDCIEAASKATYNCILASAASTIPIAHALHLNYQKYKGILAGNSAKQKAESQKKLTNNSQTKKNN